MGAKPEKVATKTRKATRKELMVPTKEAIWANPTLKAALLDYLHADVQRASDAEFYEAYEHMKSLTNNADKARAMKAMFDKFVGLVKGEMVNLTSGHMRALRNY